MQCLTAACLCVVLVLQLQGPVVDASFWDTFRLNGGEAMVDGMPVVGHIKGGIHWLAGDEENGLNIIRDATSNTGTELGGIVGGPVGAVVGRLATDKMITDIDTLASLVNGNQLKIKPYGTTNYLMNIEIKSAGEHVEAVANILMDAAGRGSPGGRIAKPMFKTLQKRMKSTVRKEFKDYLEQLQDEGRIDNNQMQAELQQWEDQNSRSEYI